MWNCRIAKQEYRIVSIDTDVIITEKLAELLGIKAGDTLKITDKDMEREVTVGAVARKLSDELCVYVADVVSADIWADTGVE